MCYEFSPPWLVGTVEVLGVIRPAAFWASFLASWVQSLGRLGGRGWVPSSTLCPLHVAAVPSWAPVSVFPWAEPHCCSCGSFCAVSGNAPWAVNRGVLGLPPCFCFLSGPSCWPLSGLWKEMLDTLCPLCWRSLIGVPFYNYSLMRTRRNVYTLLKNVWYGKFKS